MSSSSQNLTAQLFDLLGEEKFVRLCEELGGTRLYVPTNLRDSHVLVQLLGRKAASDLSRAFSPDSIRIPLARDRRALHYRRKGLTCGKIARLLGITESGVNKLFNRLEDRGD
jgi:hypothetical protein